MATTNREVDWRSASQAYNLNNSLEMRETPAGVVLRQSDRPAGPFLEFSKRDWVEFLQGVRRGEFDTTP